jgi:hypothetical protein
VLGQASSGVYALGETDEPAPITPIPLQASFVAYEPVGADFVAYEPVGADFVAYEPVRASFKARVNVGVRVWIGKEEQETDA